MQVFTVYHSEDFCSTELLNKESLTNEKNVAELDLNSRSIKDLNITAIVHLQNSQCECPKPKSISVFLKISMNNLLT